MASRTMRAAIADAPDGTVSVEQIPIPQPQAPEVLIEVAACGACHTDLHVMKGDYRFPYPCVLGHEISGHVVACGTDVHNVSIGDRVVASFILPCGRCGHCARGLDNMCELFFRINRTRGRLYDETSRLTRADGQELAMFSVGGLAEYAVAPATAVFRVPEQVPLKSASILGCSVLTAYGAARHAANVLAGQSVAIVAAGGVGLSLVQMARAFGANQIIAIDIQDSKLEAARVVGATAVINATSTDPVEAIRELTCGQGVDAAFEALGTPQTVEQAFGMTADGGTTVLIGVGSGDAAASIPLTYLVRHQLKIIGSYGGRTRTDMPVILQMAARGQINLDAMITGEASLNEVGSVYKRLANGTAVGRLLVVP